MKKVLLCLSLFLFITILGSNVVYAYTPVVVPVPNSNSSSSKKLSDAKIYFDSLIMLFDKNGEESSTEQIQYYTYIKSILNYHGISKKDSLLLDSKFEQFMTTYDLDKLDEFKFEFNRIYSDLQSFGKRVIPIILSFFLFLVVPVFCRNFIKYIMK